METVSPATSTTSTSAAAAASGDHERTLLAAVPVGSWAQYETRAPGIHSTHVVALVQRAEDGKAVLETRLRDARGSRPLLLTTRETFLPAGRAGDRPVARAAQIGANDPMDYPSTEQPREPGPGLLSVGPQTYMLTEQIVVPAGPYNARKYVLARPGGGEAAIWLEHRVYPLGIVKMCDLPASGDPAEGTVMELVNVGSDARPTIVKPPLPFDAQRYQAQMMAVAMPPVPGGEATRP